MFGAAEAVSFVLLLSFLSYVSSIVWAYLNVPAPQKGPAEDFEWHFFVPCRDEEVVIQQTIRRLRLDFPIAHVWVIDDHSEDGTARVVNTWVERDDHVHLVRRFLPDARTGKGDALNSAYAALDAHLPPCTDRTAVVVGVVDADGHLAIDCLEHIASDGVMRDGRVGAAQVAVHMRNRDYRRPVKGAGIWHTAYARYLVRMQDIEFRTVIAAMQALRSRTQSVGMGGNGQFTRLSALDAVKADAGAPWHGALLEDYELGLHVMLAGYENRYIHHTYVSQEALTGLRRLLTQRTRWSQGNIQCMKYLPAILRSRYFSSSAVLEAGYYLVFPLFQLAGLMIWPVIYYVLIVQLSHRTGLLVWFETNWWFLVLLFIVGVFPFFLWGPIYKLKCEPTTTWRRSFAYGIGSWAYIYYVYLVIPRAMYRVVTRRSGWAKTRRNDEPLDVGALAKDA